MPKELVAMDFHEPLKRRWRRAACSLATAAVVVHGLLASPSLNAAAAGTGPEESLLSSGGVRLTSASLREFLASLRDGPLERPDAIQRLIEQLGGDEFAQREAASAKLLALRVPPVRELLAAFDHPDAEIRFRARRILDQVERRSPPSAALFAAFLVIRDRNLEGLAGDVLRVASLCDAKALRLAAGQAMRATVRPADRALLQRALTSDNIHAQVIAAAGLAVIDGKTDPDVAATPVTWANFLETYLVRGRRDGERTEFLKGVPASLAMHFERKARTASTIDAVANRHGTSPWLYPVRGKNELPRPFVEAGKKHYPIQGTWRQHWTQWIVLDEDGKPTQGGPTQPPHTETRLEFLIVPVELTKKPR